MSTITTTDGTEIYYKDWGTGEPIVFSHGWPLNADAWDAQMLFFGQQGYRVIAHDRRGHGRSGQTWDGNDYDTWADDLAGLIEQLDLTNVTLIAHSMGGGEIARYVGRSGTSRLAKMVFIGAVPPLMLKTDNNPGGLPLSVFDGLRAGLIENRSQFYKDTSVAFFGYNRPDAKVSEAIREPVLAPRHAVGHQSVLRLHRAVLRNRLHRRPEEDRRSGAVHARRGRPDRPLSGRLRPCRQARAERDTEDLSRISHGMAIIEAETINADLLAFIR